MIKRFEQMEFNEDWEEDEPISTKSKGPFDDILEYGQDGPMFKCGDRVKFIDSYSFLKNKIGTVVNYDNTFYIVCFDKNINYTEADYRFRIPNGHSLVTFGYQLKHL